MRYRTFHIHLESSKWIAVQGAWVKSPFPNIKLFIHRPYNRTEKWAISEFTTGLYITLSYPNETQELFIKRVKLYLLEQTTEEDLLKKIKEKRELLGTSPSALQKRGSICKGGVK